MSVKAGSQIFERGVDRRVEVVGRAGGSLGDKNRLGHVNLNLNLKDVPVLVSLIRLADRHPARGDGADFGLQLTGARLHVLLHGS